MNLFKWENKYEIIQIIIMNKKRIKSEREKAKQSVIVIVIK